MHLSKHHGLGNDFLVLFTGPDGQNADDSSGTLEGPAGLARRLCHRRLGIGADGLIVARPGGGGADLAMELRNADGSRAEMSGNGIRCLAQAEARRRRTDTVDLRIATDAGVRAVTVRPGPGPDPATVTARVDMGPAKVRVVDGRSSSRVAEVDMGNPHLVVLDDGSGHDLEALGREHADINVELITIGTDGHIAMRVWERGVGGTEACGTGACAAAAAAHEWGLAPPQVTVSMPGGDVEVVLADTVTLVGPATHVADIEVGT